MNFILLNHELCCGIYRMLKNSSAFRPHEVGRDMQNMAVQPYAYFYGNKHSQGHGVW